MTRVSRSLRQSLAVALLVCACPGAVRAQSGSSEIDAPALYSSACAACHGPDGRGTAPEQTGLPVSLPDFADCRFASPETTDDWTAIITDGGPVRGFSRAMPAFGDALSVAEIRAVASHLRSFCRGSGWPSGDLNFARPLSTEKAFPENETVLTMSAPPGEASGELRLIYERRLGARGQFEAAIPFAARRISSEWYTGIGDVTAGYKHAVAMSRDLGTIVSGNVEVTLPSGNERYGLGTRLLVLETSALAGQRIGRRSFAHLQAGVAFPLNIASTPNEVFWRAAFGTTLNKGRASAAWTPMMEATAYRETEYRDPIRWDLIPQVQVTLSRRQHITATAGARIPVAGPSRVRTVLLSFSWDWFDGGIFEGW